MEPFQARPIEALLTGRARALGTPEVLSGIGKKARQGALWLALDGLEGDEQGDRPYPGWHCWRTTFKRRLARGQIGDWNLRLNGPAA